MKIPTRERSTMRLERPKGLWIVTSWDPVLNQRRDEPLPTYRWLARAICEENNCRVKRCFKHPRCRQRREAAAAAERRGQ